MKFEKLTTSNGEWQNLVQQWESQCEDYSENFAEYAIASMPVLEELAIGAEQLSAGVFGFKSCDKYAALCHANSSFLPSYDGKVLRIRHIVFSPRFDFSDDVPTDEYIQALVGVFTGAMDLANDEMQSNHVKFHLRSRAEREYGQAFTDALKRHGTFKTVNITGSWIYLSKA